MINLMPVVYATIVILVALIPYEILKRKIKELKSELEEKEYRVKLEEDNKEHQLEMMKREIKHLRVMTEIDNNPRRVKAVQRPKPLEEDMRIIVDELIISMYDEQTVYTEMEWELYSGAVERYAKRLGGI